MKLSTKRKTVKPFGAKNLKRAASGTNTRSVMLRTITNTHGGNDKDADR